MSFLSKIINKVYEAVEDDFTQQLTEHQVLAVINKQQQKSGLLQSSQLKQSSQNQHEDMLEMAKKISEFTPEIQFRVLGEDPSIEIIDERVIILKKKLEGLQYFLVQNYEKYFQNMNQSLSYLQQLKQCYNGRRKSQQVRTVIQKLKIVFKRGQKITKLSIHVNNLKNTLKILQTMPKTKNMTLIQLKSIDLKKFKKMNQQIGSQHKRLQCIDNLCNYIEKITNQQFVYIIEKIKQSFTQFEESKYDEIVRTFLVVAPSTNLHKLISSLLQAHLRNIADVSLDYQSQICKISKDILRVIINLHKMIKWHKINRAVVTQVKSRKLEGKNQVNQMNNGIMNDCENQITRHRQLSTDSNFSEETKQTIEVSELVMIDPLDLKQIFLRTVDSCLADLLECHCLIQEMELQKMYQYIYSLSKLAQICSSFTGMSFERVRNVILNYVQNREMNLYLKNAKELSISLENQKNQWNRLPFKNDYRYTNLDKLIMKAEKMEKIEQYKKASLKIKKMMKNRNVSMLNVSKMINQQDNENQEAEWNHDEQKLPSLQKIQKQFQQWSTGKDFLKFYQGDAIVCQSSLKILNIFQKHFDLALMTNAIGQSFVILQHMLILIEFYIYYIFNTFLSGAYKRMFFDSINNYESLDKKYTKKRLTFLYPQISSFITRFRKTNQETNEKDSIYFKKDIKQVSAQNSQILRAKVVATESCRFFIAYFQRISRKISSEELQQKVQNLKQLIGQVSLLLLSESSQKMLGLQLQGMKYIFQSIKWSQPYNQIKQYVGKVINLTKESFEKVKSSSRGQIPIKVVYRIFVLIWRTLITYSIKLFLQSKGNNNLKNKHNFKNFIEQMYLSMHNKNNEELSQLQKAFTTFVSIFDIIICDEWEKSRKMLIQTIKKYQYIFPIVMALFDNCQKMVELNQIQKQRERSKFKEEIAEQLDLNQ